MHKKIKISPDVIPHDQFHTGVWLLSIKRPEWYYLMKKENGNTIKNGDFIESVDAPLRELVCFLHSRGIKTTPSCSGHQKKEKQFGKIYEALLKDKKEIKNEGLQLKDIESGKKYLYKDKKYELPWDRESFSDKALKYQHKGVIGIRLAENDVRKTRILQLHIPRVKIKEKDAIVFIYTAETTPSAIRNKWKIITREITTIFQEGA